jgi:Glutathione S-transferase N-terminal domain
MSAEQSPRQAVTLYRGWPDRGCYVWSPFVTKLEFHLRLSGMSYAVEAGSPLKAPKGKIPYVDLRQDGTTESVGDSALIIKRMVELERLKDLSATLPAPIKAQDLAIRALLEEKLYFYHVRSYPPW